MAADTTFAGLRAEEWAAVGACFSALLTLALVAVAVRQLKAVAALNAEQARPYIVVDFSFRSILVSLSVKNTGRAAASNVSIRLDEPPTSAVMPDVSWQHSPLFKDGMSFVAPGRELRFVLDMFDRRVSKGLPMSLSGTATYSWVRDAKTETYSERFALDLSGFSTALLPPKEVADIGDELEKIRKLLAQRQP